MVKYLENLNLLYVEDNLNILQNNKNTFEILFKNVYLASNYQKSIKIFKDNHIDLLIVDIELCEEKNGFDIANTIRTYDNTLPIVFLTSHEQNNLILKAINTNMNGYLIKPLELDQLLNTLHTIFRKNEDRIKFNNFIYDFNTLELFDINLNKILLGKKENQLLEVFLKNTNQIFSRDELEYEIWDEPVYSPSLLKNLIASLRNKMGKNIIINESKIGWRINID